ncbi:allantoinase AllB [Demequina muriae]|uniref:allantoinase n=1 Tax=Demequina muriae TaxID=3051664 RepID=A0ABT8GIJ1_9MICO|nr:allantoinase AllB [Demequina sp. EGI L300058]MDN4481194.1 allantoinase AllB [Demequina sp. EGI L300058]
MTDFDLVVRGDRVLIDGTWKRAAVGVKDGIVARIGPRHAEWSATQTVSLATDEVLIPGVVDTHVHVNEPGRTHWEGFATATRAAAAGGVTTIIDMPLNSIPPTTTVAALDAKRAAAAENAAVDVGFWGGAIPASLGALEPLHDAGVFGFKAFLSPSGVDEFPHLSAAQLRAALAETARFGGMVIVHAEDPARLERYAGSRYYEDFVASRPDASETSAIATIISALRATGGRAHILHLSSAAALNQIRGAKAEGLQLTVETCPHYLTFDADHIPDGATEFKCCPPVRDEDNREALWGALVDGTIDFVASDHSPATAELKVGADGDFGRAWGGISGLQVMLAAVTSGAATRGIPLETALSWLTSKPAAFVGLEDKGTIREGARGDVVAFAPGRAWTVDAADLQHRNKVSAFDGRTLTGQVTRTWVGGAQVHPAVPDAPLAGRLIARPALAVQGAAAVDQP